MMNIKITTKKPYLRLNNQGKLGDKPTLQNVNSANPRIAQFTGNKGDEFIRRSKSSPALLQRNSIKPAPAYVGLKRMVKALLNNKENRKYMNLKTDLRKEVLKEAAYAVYEADRPSEAKPLSLHEQRAMLNKIGRVVNNYREKVNITPQSILVDQWDIFYVDFFKKVGFNRWKEQFLEDALEEFAYFVQPKKRKEKPYKARLSLSFNSQFAGAIFEKLVQFISEGKNRNLVEKLKVMGPQEQGTRTDSAVIYLNTDNPTQIKNIAKELREYIDERVFYAHVPLGMREVSKGISTAVYNPKSLNTSHGHAIASLVAEIFVKYWKERHKMKRNLEELPQKTEKKQKIKPDLDKLIQKVLRKRGFNPEDPSRLLSEGELLLNDQK